MKPQLIIQFEANGAGRVRWMRMDAEKGATPVASGTLEELAMQTLGAQIIVLVPSTEILLTQAAVPTSNRQRLLKAIPFVLEDQLASNVDDLHFALGERNEAGEITVAVVSRKLMDDWQGRCREAGIHPHYMVPDVLALPYAENEWSLYIDQGDAMLRNARQSGFAMDPSNVEFMCALTLEQAADKEKTPTAIRVWRTENTGEVNFAFEGVEVPAAEVVTNLLSVIAASQRGVELEAAVNLLQGDYSRREQLGKLWRPWRFAAGLAGVWFLLQVGITISENLTLSAQKDQLQSEVEKIYKTAFPDAKRVVNAKVQMERKLEELRGGGQAGGKQFMGLLTDAGGVIRQTNGLVLRSVRYKNNEMDVELELPNLQALDELKNKLTTESKLAVEIQSAASKDNKVQGRLHIKSNS